MHIPNYDTQNYPICRLELVVETFGHSTKWTNKSKLKVPKVVKPTNKTFGTSVINSPMSTPSLVGSSLNDFLQSTGGFLAAGLFGAGFLVLGFFIYFDFVSKDIASSSFSWRIDIIYLDNPSDPIFFQTLKGILSRHKPLSIFCYIREIANF